MKDLIKGIYDRFLVANDFKTAVSSRFYLNSAPQAATMPYAVFQLINNTTDYNFTSTFDLADIQIDIIDDNYSSDILDTAKKCMAHFDDCTLTVSGYQFLNMQREFNFMIEDPESELQRYVIQYSILTRK